MIMLYSTILYYTVLHYIYNALYYVLPNYSDYSALYSEISHHSFLCDVLFHYSSLNYIVLLIIEDHVVRSESISYYIKVYCIFLQTDSSSRFLGFRGFTLSQLGQARRGLKGF